MASKALVSITAAAFETGVARRTIQRWLQAGRLLKRKSGKISVADVRRCVAEQRTGRPGGMTFTLSKVTKVDFEISKLGSLDAVRDALPYLRTDGLQRLRRLLRVVLQHCHQRGKAKAFTEILTEVLSNCVSREAAEREHWHRFNKRSSVSIARGINGTWKRIRAARRALARGEKPPRLYRQDKPFVDMPPPIAKPPPLSAEATERIRRERLKELSEEAKAKDAFRPSWHPASSPKRPSPSRSVPEA